MCWDSNPAKIKFETQNQSGWDSNPAKTHTNWFQDLMKLRFLMFHNQNNFSSSSVTQSCPTLWDPMNCSTPGLPVKVTKSQYPSKPMSIKSVMPSNHLIFCCPLLLLPPIPPSIRFFSNESVLHVRWPKYWSFSFSISPS